MDKQKPIHLDMETRSSVPLGDTHFGCVGDHAYMMRDGPDIVHNDGTMIDYKTAADYGTGDEVVVVMGGDLVHHDYAALERRILARMETVEAFIIFRDRFNKCVESMTARRPRPPEPMDFPRELLREKPKRDWEQRNRKQRRK